ncbi:MAG: putative transport system ATP-binding protein [Mycobacterium sp.]|jgi:putative ABC transport system ATP-binding protein|nr:putative transport system ATP-binding protein [Mycobacterium sp.]
MSPDAPAIEARAVTRTYQGGGHQVRGVDQVSLAAARGEVVAVTGPSGSGKSTLLFLLGGLDVPDAGQVCVTGVDWATLRGRARARFRRETCSFIVQGLALLPQATAAENVEVPLLLDAVEPTARARRVAEALERVGLAQHALKLTDQLSGGQQQRVAIARALVVEPAVVLADEPTGSLDSVTAEEIVRLLVAAARERDAAVVMVTHDPTVAAHADRVVAMHSGRLQ